MKPLDATTLDSTRTLTLRELWLIMGLSVIAGLGIGASSMNLWRDYSAKQVCERSGGDVVFGQCWLTLRSSDEWNRLRKLGMVNENGYLRKTSLPPNPLERE